MKTDETITRSRNCKAAEEDVRPADVWDTHTHTKTCVIFLVFGQNTNKFHAV